MNTRSLTGWLLVIGPILTFVVLAGLYSALIGDGDPGPAAVADLMKNTQLSLIVTSLGSVVFVATFIGMALLANSMNAEGQAGSAYAAVAGVIFAGLAAIGIVATGMNAATIEVAATSVESAAIMELVGNGMFSGLFFYWAIGNILIGSTILIQKRFHIAVGWLFVVVGILMIFGSVVDAEIPDAVGLIIWVGVELVAVVAGVFVLREK